jgi:Fur family peroxide stress response transcriptional regulator
MNKKIEIRDLISSHGLKVTPQRMRVLEAIYSLNNHPTAENVIELIRKEDPNISSGTVYKVLETLVDKNLIQKVKTEKDAMRYDGVMEKHHHLYCKECDHIEDYKNPKLDELIKDFFEKNKIENYTIEDIKLNITGNFIIHKNIKH